MTGKTHKMIGIASGVAMCLYGIGKGHPEYAICMITSPIGAMLPDIDHNRTKLGHKRKQFFHMIHVGGFLCFLALVFTTLLSIMIQSSANRIPLFLLLLFSSVILLFLFLSSNPKIKKRLKFFTKHRGIMHTLIIPALCFLASYFLSSPYIQALFIGLFTGSLSHLLADCCTKAGCPILWPITKKNISILKITTGTKMEYLVGFLLSGGLIWTGFLMGR